MWGGSGSGNPCTICAVSIDPGQSELELEFVDESGITSYRVHASCYLDSEAGRRPPAAVKPTGPTSGTRRLSVEGSESLLPGAADVDKNPDRGGPGPNRPR
jgi:hypothetical protein